APCHLQHAQRVHATPMRVLSQLEGAEVHEGPDSAWCCGSAGTYNLTHPGLSRQMLDRKMKTILPLAPDIIASGNPGCLMQLRWGVQRWKIAAEVRHPVELLARGYRKPAGRNLRRHRDLKCRNENPRRRAGDRSHSVTS
ncbi:MAG: heterodisulfide reductase-related iron-sulfur binding cluster, partial [Deltaproteobacteria bacterium]|nr:heterodisulfide reductase-related iron-sulfur binding cluster [Deltaproteobacteria bacterium]